MEMMAAEKTRVTEREIPALAPGESVRGFGRRARGVSVGIGGSVGSGVEFADVELLEVPGGVSDGEELGGN
jgi:hypothetical protein